MTTITWESSAASFNAALALAPDILEKHMGRATRRSLLEISRQARRDAPKAFTELASSIQIETLGPLEGITGPSVDYGEMVEKGTGPGGFPSIDTMLDWIQVKGIVPENFEVTDHQLAYLLQQSIGEKGTPAQPYLEPAAEQLSGNVTRHYDQALDRALDEIARR